ncbi:hypothetical protein [Rhizobium rhizoryzae]|uniref:hypothetical protein n=1 Tax=Rhizobium rhizoryzae TaxID=451876 RepID=UPI0028B21EEF|nr:hypothetical protein [Rhizobium rhizoryzae]
MNLTTFEAHLRKLIGDPTPLRPFVCHGSPLECEIFLVGIEAATKMKTGFWDFWKPGYGFDRNAWQEAYIKERRQLGKPAKSPTRRNTDCFLDGAEGFQVLETNVYAAPRSRYKRDGSEIRAPFQFLLEAIKPKLIFVHGGAARKELNRMNLSIPILEANHLSYQTSQDTARDYGRQAAETLRG